MSVTAVASFPCCCLPRPCRRRFTSAAWPPFNILVQLEGEGLRRRTPFFAVAYAAGVVVVLRVRARCVDAELGAPVSAPPGMSSISMTCRCTRLCLPDSEKWPVVLAVCHRKALLVLGRRLIRRNVGGTSFSCSSVVNRDRDVLVVAQLRAACVRLRFGPRRSVRLRNPVRPPYALPARSLMMPL